MKDSTDSPAVKFSVAPEAIILRVGVAWVLLWMAVLGVVTWYLPEVGFKMWRIIGFQALGGRAAGISTGVVKNVPQWLVVVMVFSVDMAIVFLFYPLFVYFYRFGARKWGRNGTLSQTMREARKGRKWVGRFGLMGLVFFVWFPLYATGPLIGAIVGFFLRLRPWANLAAVGTGTMLATLSWLFVFDRFIEWMGELAGSLVPLIPWVVLVTALIVYLVLKIRSRRNPGAEDEEDME